MKSASDKLDRLAKVLEPMGQLAQLADVFEPIKKFQEEACEKAGCLELLRVRLWSRKRQLGPPFPVMICDLKKASEFYGASGMTCNSGSGFIASWPRKGRS